MTQWAVELLLALRAAGWPEPENARPRYLGYGTLGGMINIAEAEVRVISLFDQLSISGPPRGVAQMLHYWRWIAP